MSSQLKVQWRGLCTAQGDPHYFQSTSLTDSDSQASTVSGLRGVRSGDLMKRSLITFLFFLVFAIPSFAASPLASGRGGPFFEFHTNSLSSFDPDIEGNALVVGGVGFGAAGKKFRIGGGGGGGFLWDASSDVSFGMGYGGVIAEYEVTHWLSTAILIGGGGYAIAKILSETETQTTFEKVSSGGFVLFYPQVNIEVPLKGFMSLTGKIGYFLPNNSRLHSFTVGLALLFGKL